MSITLFFRAKKLNTCLFPNDPTASLRCPFSPPAIPVSIPRQPTHRIQHLLSHARDGNAHHGWHYLAKLSSHASLSPLWPRYDGRDCVQETDGQAGSRVGRSDMVLDFRHRLCARIGRCLARVRRRWCTPVTGMDESMAADRKDGAFSPMGDECDQYDVTSIAARDVE